MTEFEDSELTPSGRADRCVAVVECYTDFYPDTNIIDLLTDLRHWCDQNRQSYARFDRIAAQRYVAHRRAMKKRRSE